MKQVTLNFREVAVEGLPEESGDYAVIQSYLFCEKPNELMFSSVHQLWNATDNTTREKAEETAIVMKGVPRHGEITHWIPLDEFNSAFNGGETP